MVTLHQQLTDRYLAHLAGNPDAAYARRAFDAGVRAGLEVAADVAMKKADWYASLPGGEKVIGFGAANNIEERLRALSKELE